LRQRLDIDLLCEFDGIIDLDAEIANGALDLGLNEWQLGYVRSTDLATLISAKAVPEVVC
jgi:hypothetical protein